MRVRKRERERLNSYACKGEHTLFSSQRESERNRVRVREKERGREREKEVGRERKKEGGRERKR